MDELLQISINKSESLTREKHRRILRTLLQTLLLHLPHSMCEVGEVQLQEEKVLPDKTRSVWRRAVKAFVDVVGCQACRGPEGLKSRKAVEL